MAPGLASAIAPAPPVSVGVSVGKGRQEEGGSGAVQTRLGAVGPVTDPDPSVGHGAPVPLGALCAPRARHPSLAPCVPWIGRGGSAAGVLCWAWEESWWNTKKRRLLSILRTFCNGSTLQTAHKGRLPVVTSRLAAVSSQAGPVSVTAAESLGGFGGPPGSPGCWGSGSFCPPSSPLSLPHPSKQVCFLRGPGALHWTNTFVPSVWRSPGLWVWVVLYTSSSVTQMQAFVVGVKARSKGS